MSYTTGMSNTIPAKNPLTEKIKILQDSIKQSASHLTKCELCPRRCGVNRTKGQKGFCKAGILPAVYSYFPHTGEEPPVSGNRGSGTIFFTHCTMSCVYCQNYSFSQLSNEKEITTKGLSEIMLSLQGHGCHNINLVTPSHFVPQILEALLTATREGLRIPIIYNTSGYELVDTLKLLKGVVDVYLPDMRYGDNENSKKFSDAPDYASINRDAVKEMFSQVGNLETDKHGIAKKGVICRHLVLPGNTASSEKIFKFLSGDISKEVYISLMSQYCPTYKADMFPEINRRISTREYEEAVNLLSKYELANGWIQEAPDNMGSSLLGTNIKPNFGPPKAG